MAEEKIPRLVEGADARAHDIGAKEGFVHSCVDGVLNLDDIADVTVLPPEEVLRVVDHLISLELVEWVEPKASSAPPETETDSGDGVQLDEGIQQRILEAFHRADKLNHYERLGITIDASSGEVRKAYFALSKTFHPDAYFGKRLGSFQTKMEVVFRKITDSYEAIGRPKKREAYDRYLRQQMAVSATEKQMDRVEERAQAMSRALTKAPVAERQSAVADGTDDWMSAEIPDPIPIRETAVPAKSIVPGSPEHARMQRKRELLEKRLLGKAKPQPAKPRRSSPVERVGKKAALRDLTRSLKHTAALTGGVDRSQHHIENARIAEAEGDLASAATALRMAIAIDSSSPELQEQYRRVNSNLRVQLLDIHRQQAKYEEENNLWAAASISWAKVAEAAPDDAEAPRRAAKAILGAGGDLRKARDFAQRSLELKADSLDTRLLLARIYIDAGMDQSAAKELDEAAKLDPSHEMVKNLRKQLGG